MHGSCLSGLSFSSRIFATLDLSPQAQPHSVGFIHAAVALVTPGTRTMPHCVLFRAPSLLNAALTAAAGPLMTFCWRTCWQSCLSFVSWTSHIVGGSPQPSVTRTSLLLQVIPQTLLMQWRSMLLQQELLQGIFFRVCQLLSEACFWLSTDCVCGGSWHSLLACEELQDTSVLSLVCRCIRV